MYRVDIRLFKIDTVIEPSAVSFQESNNFDENKLKLEDVLVKEAPEYKSTVRSNSLYLFNCLSDALKFSIRKSDSKVYKVKPFEGGSLIHRGDMVWTELMYEFISHDDLLQKMAKNYWNGIKTYKPCWEMLVDKILVTSLIIRDETEREELKELYHNNSGNIEKIHFYKDNL